MLAKQVATWQSAGFLEFCQKHRLRLYQLLAGDVPSTADELELDWQPALCTHLG